MKKFFVAVIAFGLLMSCGDKNSKSGESGTVDPNLIENNMTADNPNAENPEPQFSFDEMTWNFGKINEGTIVTHTFKFTNTGNEELIISSCKASCGCTTPLCDQQPVAPGEEGKIKVKFDSKNRKHNINKQVTIVANTNPPTTVLTLKGYVTPVGEF